MKNDSEWMLAVLAELIEFCEENELSESHKAIVAALKATKLELEEAKQNLATPDAANNKNEKPKKLQ